MRAGAGVVAGLIALVGLGAAACGGAAPAASADPSGLATVFDSSRADTIVARVAGEVPAAKVRTLTEERRVQPDAEDTTLFTQAYGFVVGPDGRVFVPDEGSMRIFVLDSAGALVRTIGRKGAGPGEFDQFNGLRALADGRLAVLDVGNARVSFFSATGDFETSWRVPTGHFANDQLVADAAGTLRMVLPVTPPTDTDIIGRRGLVRLSADGTVGDSLVPPDLGTRQVTFVAAQGGGRTQYRAAYSPNDSWAWHPQGFFVSATGTRAQVHLGKGPRPVRIERDAPAIPVPADEIAADRERILFGMRRTDPAWSGAVDLPATKPPIESVRATRDGRIWVRVATPSEPIPPEARDEARPDRPPPARWRSPAVFEVFEADGRFVGRVTFPRRTTLMEADGDRVWALVRDEDGLPGVVRFRVTPGF